MSVETILRGVNVLPKPATMRIRELLLEVDKVVADAEVKRSEAAAAMAREERSFAWSDELPAADGWYWVELPGMPPTPLRRSVAASYRNTPGVRYCGPMREPK